MKTSFHIHFGHFSDHLFRYNAKRYRHLFLLLSLLICSLNGSAQSISSAKIKSTSTNRLEVTFSAPVTVTDNGVGFRLIGGVARIKRLLSGSGTAILTFELTDYVLSNSDARGYKLLHWPELSDARSSSGKLMSLNTSVENQAASFNTTTRKLYYVSSSKGNDSNLTNSKTAPFKTIGKAQSLAKAGDYILLRRGDTFSAFAVDKSGNSTAGPIVYTAYNDNSSAYDPKPKVTGRADVGGLYPGAILSHKKDYVVVDNLNVVSEKNGISVVQTGSYLVISNCALDGSGPETQGGIDFANVRTDQNRYVGPLLLNNTIKRFRRSIHFSGFPYNKNYKVVGGTIENNICQDNRSNDASDGIVLNRGSFGGMIVRKNDISDYWDDGIDLFAGASIIVEYNTIHSPSPTTASDNSRKGIKAGGKTRINPDGESDIILDYRGDSVTVRYNTITGLNATSCTDCNGIDGNLAATGQIYGNVVYGVTKAGILVNGAPSTRGWDIYNNTVLKCGVNGIQIYQPGTESNRIRIKNNILEGAQRGIYVSDGNESKKVVGANNVIVTANSTSNSGGAYQSTTDQVATAESLFFSYSDNNFLLKAGAPAINAGTSSVPVYTKDIRGYLVNGNIDAGAYEFGDKFPPAVPPASTNVWLEAECAAIRGAIWEIVTEAGASSGKYARVKSGNYSANNAPDASGQLSFSFSVSQAGTYKMFTRHKSLNGLDDSYWLKVNNGSWVQKGVAIDADAFVWEQTGGTLTLNAGTNTITIGFREPDFRLDKIYITLNGTLPTGTGGDAYNCSSNARVADRTKEKFLTEEKPLESAKELEAYPNPADSHLLIQYPNDVSTKSLVLTDITGRVVFQLPATSSANGDLEIPTSDLPNGMYLLRWQSEVAQRVVKVLVDH